MEPSNFIFNEKLIREKTFSYDSPSRFSIKDDFFTPSAVLFTIIPYKDKPYELVVIHRADKGKSHRGEMSFPGGKYEPQDSSLKVTALREAEEEIGVPRANIDVIGCLHDFPTMSRFIISPFIATIDKNQELTKDEREVQEIVKVPITFFTEKQNFRETTMNFEGKEFPVLYFDYKVNNTSYMIWGATAYMICTFIEMVYDLKLSKLGLRRFNLKEIKTLKKSILNRDKINDFNKLSK
jgi:8-oxo-dGTP pyrophosphatase MutT (NUDIX family)